MKVMFDVDGVLAEFTESFTRLAFQHGLYKKIVKGKDQATWAFDSENGDKMDEQAVWDIIDNSMNWWCTLNPMATEKEIDMLVDWMANKKNTAYFMTARKNTVGSNADLQTRFWLKSIGIDTERWQVIAGVKDKGKLCKERDITIGIDDKPSNLISLYNAGVTPIVMDYQYNRELTHFNRVNSLGEFLEKYCG